MNTSTRSGIPWAFFVLVILLTIPFWVFGNQPLPIPMKLPVSALAWANPLIAAAILTYRADGRAGMRALFRKAWDYPKIRRKLWYLPILLINPLIMLLAYIVMRAAGRPLPDAQIPWLAAPVILLAFLITGIGEELGWMGYAFDPLQNRFGALAASLALGVFWALFHLIPDLQNDQSAQWIFWHRISSIAVRTQMAWIYNNTGKSVFAVILFHAMNNLSWALFPNYGSHYDPFVTAVITLIVTGLILLGTVPTTLFPRRRGGGAPA